MEPVNTIKTVHTIPFDFDVYTQLRLLVWPMEINQELLDVELSNWLLQGFTFSKEFELGFYQHKNGPCGVLAVVQAELFRDLIFGVGNWKDPHTLPPQYVIRASLSRSLSRMLFRAKVDTCKVVLRQANLPFSLTSPDNLIIHEIVDPQVLTNFISDNLDQFISPGGTVLFLYSLVLSRGLQQIQADLSTVTRGDSALVVGNWALCSQGLVNLCLIGRALPEVDDETMGVYLDDIQIGFLTYEEVENMMFASGFSLLTDRFKHPTYPIWILHGGDHYTTLYGFDPKIQTYGKPKNQSTPGSDSGKCVGGCGFFGNPVSYGYCSSCYKKQTQGEGNVEGGERKPCLGGCGFFGNRDNCGYCSVCWKNLPPSEQTKLQKAKAPPLPTITALNAPYSFEIFHYNGLPPAGPHLARLSVIKKDENQIDNQPDVLLNIAMVIQRKWAGTEEDGWWIYEIAQRKDDKEKKEEQVPVPKEQWRCAYCVINEVYGMNPPDTSICQTCHQSINNCGQTIWVKYQQLGLLAKREVDSRYSPKIQSLIHTRWPFTEVDYSGKKPPTI